MSRAEGWWLRGSHDSDTAIFPFLICEWGPFLFSFNYLLNFF